MGINGGQCLCLVAQVPWVVVAFFSIMTSMVPSLHGIGSRELIMNGMKRHATANASADLEDPERRKFVRQSLISRTRQLSYTLWESIGYHDPLDHSPEEDVYVEGIYPHQPKVLCRIFYPNETDRAKVAKHNHHLDTEGLKLQNLKAETDDGKYPLVVFVHGGGWILPNVHDPLVARLATINNLVVASVEYRLAPEHQYPAAIQDCHAALQHFMRFGEEKYGINPSFIYMMGDSAGGQLAMSTSLWARDHGWRIPGAILIYPVVDYVSTVPGHLLESDSSRTGDNLTRFLNFEEMRTCWNLYLPEDVRNDPDKQLDPAHSPLRAPDMHKFPPLQLISSKRDILYEQAQELERAYTEKGLFVSHERFDDMPHNFAIFRFLFHQEIAQVESAIQDFLLEQTQNERENKTHQQRKQETEEQRQADEQRRLEEGEQIKRPEKKQKRRNAEKRKQEEQQQQAAHQRREANDRLQEEKDRKIREENARKLQARARQRKQ